MYEMKIHRKETIQMEYSDSSYHNVNNTKYNITLGVSGLRHHEMDGMTTN